MHPDCEFVQLELSPPVLVVRKVGVNSHVAFDGAYYSVPHDLLKSPVVVRAFPSSIDILDQNGRCVASHKRSYRKHAYVTVPSHMPLYYRSFYNDSCYDGAMLRKWAKNIGENTSLLIDQMLSDKLIEEHAYKSCLAVLQLSKKFGAKRLNDACGFALSVDKGSFYTVRKCLADRSKKESCS